MKLKINSLFAGLLLAACTVNAQQWPPPGGQPPQPPSREARLKQVSSRLEKDLGLKPDQKQKVADAYGKFFDGIEKLRGGQPGPPPPPPPGKREDVEKLAKVRDESIKKTLTDAQFKKYQEIEKTMRPGRPGGPPPPPPAG
jgi:hypothetical protein